MLPCVLPDQQGSAHVHVEGADDPLLRDLHTHIQQLEQVGRNTFPLVAKRTEENNSWTFLWLNAADTLRDSISLMEQFDNLHKHLLTYKINVTCEVTVVQLYSAEGKSKSTSTTRANRVIICVFSHAD